MISQGSWHDNWAGLRVAVLGLGKSGFSVADTLCELGSDVTVLAQKASPEFTELLDLIGAKLVLSDSVEALQALEQLDFAVISPGFAPNHPAVEWLTQSGIPMLTDIDLAWRLRDKTDRVAKWITITGTNGKTTTTELVTHMLQSAGRRAVACGNIGNPILDMVREPEGFDYLVVEISSFQLHYSHDFSPIASAFLNFAPDHIDWHGSELEYFQAKAKVYQGTEVAIVYNAADPKTLEAAEAADVVEGCRAVAFTIGMPSVSMVGYVEEFLVDRAFTNDRYSAALEIAEESDLAAIGVLSNHLRANVAAAAALARAVDVEPAVIKRAIASFELSPHRIQKVLQHDGILFIDDSKATNAHAASASLASFDSIVWIVGGLLKGVDPTPLLLEHGTRFKAAVVIGADTQELEGLFASHLPNLPLRVISGDRVMEQAVSAAIEFAATGDTVLLAPAAASMDQFQDYADRGNQFQAEVRKQVIA
jgi:UDP-N-acetylmuramoylalanine--D-glutamate ligase